jgi:hypothetical protein
MNDEPRTHSWDQVSLHKTGPASLRKGTPMTSFQDINHDGLLDLVVQVSTEALQISASDTEALLKGNTFAGKSVRGVDTIRVVP